MPFLFLKPDRKECILHKELAAQANHVNSYQIAKIYPCFIYDGVLNL
jgi:hypothetical protein